MRFLQRSRSSILHPLSSIFDPLSLCLSVSLSLCLLFLPGCFGKSEPPPILVGHVVPQSGAEKAIGRHGKQGILLAVEEANKEDNRIQGRKVNVLHPDAAGDGETIRGVGVRLATVNKVAGLLGESEALASVAQSYEIPALIGDGLDGRPATDFVFYTGLPPSFRGQVLARFAAQELKATKVAVLIRAQESEIETRGEKDTETRRRGDTEIASSPRRRVAVSHVGSEVAEAFAKEFRKAQGASLVGEWTYKDRSELKALIEQIKGRKADAVLLAGRADDVFDLRGAGLDEKVPLLAGSADVDSSSFQPVTNIYWTTVFVADAGPRAREFADKFRERFHEMPDAHAALGYDSARILFEAMRRAKPLDNPTVKQMLADMKDFDTLTGSITFKDQACGRPAFVVHLDKGMVKTVKRYEAQ